VMQRSDFLQLSSEFLEKVLSLGEVFMVKIKFHHCLFIFSIGSYFIYLLVFELHQREERVKFAFKKKIHF
jgi:hypothetical protein